MRRLSVIVLVALACVFAVGCGDDGEAAPDAFVTICGNPGDTGNELGIGQYCEILGDCINTVNAPLCSTAGDPQAHFCTTTCNPDSDAGPSNCGTGATCECGNGGCGCTPDVCLD